MKKIQIVMFLSMLAVSLGLQTVLAKDAPVSAEQLRSELESALQRKDTNAVFSLINWDGVSDRIRSFQREQMTKFAEHGIVGVKQLPLTTDFRLIFERNGVRYSPNVAVEGLFEVEFAKLDNAESTPKVTFKMPYGKKGDVFYLSCTIEEKIPDSPVPSADAPHP